MRKLFFIPIALLFIFISCVNNKGVSEAFSKYRHEDGVTSVTIPGWIIGLAARMGDLEKEERDLLRNIDKVRVLTIEDKGLNNRTNFHEEFYRKVALDPLMEELLVVRNDNDQVTIFGKGTEKAFDELLILVGGEDNAMVYIKGKIKPETLSGVISKNSQNGLFSWKNSFNAGPVF